MLRVTDTRGAVGCKKLSVVIAHNRGEEKVVTVGTVPSTPENKELLAFADKEIDVTVKVIGDGITDATFEVWRINTDDVDLLLSLVETLGASCRDHG